MERDRYIYKKEKKVSVTENGEDKTESVLMFGMTPEYMEFMEGDEAKKIEFDSIEKMYHGKKPHPKRLHLVIQDHREEDVPEWVLDEFKDVPERISEHSGLTQTKGPELEKTGLDKLKKYADLSFKIFFIGVVGIAIIGGLLLFLVSPFCFGPLWGITIVSLIWLGIKIFREPGVDERVWKRKQTNPD